MKAGMSLEDRFYGAATVGDRGQVVIPADARKKLGINPGDKVLVLGHPIGEGLLLCKIDHLRDILSAHLHELDRLAGEITESSSEEV